MIQHLVPDEATLRAYLPNIQATVKGETNIYNKMQPFIAEASKIITASFELQFAVSIPDDIAGQMLAVKAMELAAPSLDCVLTPNGFAVVYNQTMMPSAKIQGQKPLDRLLDSLRDRYFKQSLLLVSVLLDDEGWQMSSCFETWGNAVFSPSVLVSVFNLPDLTDIYTIRRQLDSAQTIIQDNLVSAPLMARLYRLAIHPEEATREEKQLLLLVQSAVASFIRTTSYPTTICNRIAHLLKSNPSAFSDWAETSIGQGWLTPPDFSNDPKSSGYFF